MRLAIRAGACWDGACCDTQARPCSDTAPTSPPALSVSRTLKVKTESHAWLNAAAGEVNSVWNWTHSVSEQAARPCVGPPKWLTGFDLNNLSSGASEYFQKIGADTIQRVNGEHAVQ